MPKCGCCGSTVHTVGTCPKRKIIDEPDNVTYKKFLNTVAARKAARAYMDPRVRERERREARRANRWEKASRGERRREKRKI